MGTKTDEIAVGDDEVRMALQEGDGVGNRLRQHDIVVRDQDDVRRCNVRYGSGELVRHPVFGSEMAELGDARSGAADRFGIFRLARIQHDDAVSKFVAVQKAQLSRTFVRPVPGWDESRQHGVRKRTYHAAARTTADCSASTTSSISVSDRLV